MWGEQNTMEVGEMARKYHRGQHISEIYYNYAQDGTTLVDCDTGYPKISIWDPTDTLKVDAQAMTSTDTGTYEYTAYQIPADGEFGWWRYLVLAVESSNETPVRDGFEVI